MFRKDITTIERITNKTRIIPPCNSGRLLAAALILVLTIESITCSTLDIYKSARLGHRIVQTRYGRLHGLILPLDNFRFLRSVEVFLGVPYATPPIKQNRFSPTRAPAPWDGIRISDKYSPVCPQRLPNIQNETAALEKMPKGRLEYLRRLLPFLENQSEDCLYLNIFSPINAASTEKKLPVIVFIHGESFEWSGGNPYDGSVLASYGEVVVVTLNYRLGILGFLNANPSPQTHARVANYGLMDQMAALHWIQQNIQKFGGDPNMVTLAGHGTGAACINFLMTSPTMVRGLFHRSILLSGSSSSSWALVQDPVIFALKLAKEVNCTIPEDLIKHHEQIVDCLREVSLEDLYAAEIQAPNFLTSFGPSVDGVVIRSGHSNLDIDDLISHNLKRYASMGSSSSSTSSSSSSFSSSSVSSSENSNSAGNSGGNGGGYAGGGYGSGQNGYNTGSNYDVLFGVVTGEAIWRFSAHDIQNGFEGERRDKIIRTYVRNAYNYHLNEIFYTIVNEYTDWDRASQHPINTRDTAVAALSDAQFVAPIIRTGDILSAQSPPPASSGSQSDKSSSSSSSSNGGPRCYFYVFDYQTKDGDYPQRMGTVHGEDLPYIFGAPLVDGFGHFPTNYTKSEVALSEAVIIFWTNFARTGNPNEHHRQDSVLPASKERNRFRSITWESYDPLHQKYLEIGMKPRIKNHFRAHQLSIWLRLIPELHRSGMEDVITRHNLFKNHDDMDLYEGPVKPDPFTSRLLLIEDAILKKGIRINSSGHVTGMLGGLTTVEPNMFTTCIPVTGNYSPAAGVFAPTTIVNATTDTLSGFEAAGYAAYSTALSVTIAIGCSLLILNVLIFAGVYYQRDKTRLEVKTLQKQYQQRGMHQQVAYPDPIKHAHYHMGHSQSANVIVDVESHGDQGGILMSADIKPPPPHICSNAMQIGNSGGIGGSTATICGIQSKMSQQSTLPPPPPPTASGTTTASDNINSGMLGGGGDGGGNLTYGSANNKQQQQQQQHQLAPSSREHMQLKAGVAIGGGGGGGGGGGSGSSTATQTFNRNIMQSTSNSSNNSSGVSGSSGSNVTYNAGMMTLPKAGTLHHSNSINYGRSSGNSGGAGNIGHTHSPNSGPMLDIRTNNSSNDCMTLPRNLSSLRHNQSSLGSDVVQQQLQYQQQQQQQQQPQNKHQPNGNVMSGIGGVGVGGIGGIHHHSIRAPRPPIRTASSAMAVGVNMSEQTQMNSVNSGVSSNNSSSSGVSSATSSKTHHHQTLQQHSHQHQQHQHQHQSDSIGMTTATNATGGAHLKQQVPKSAIDEMRV